LKVHAKNNQISKNVDLRSHCKLKRQGFFLVLHLENILIMKQLCLLQDVIRRQLECARFDELQTDYLQVQLREIEVISKVERSQ